MITGHLLWIRCNTKNWDKILPFSRVYKIIKSSNSVLCKLLNVCKPFKTNSRTSSTYAQFTVKMYTKTTTKKQPQT